jgi:hypothetical protein
VLSTGNSVGLIDWKEPGKLGGKVQRLKRSVASSIRDVNCSPIDPTLVAAVTSDYVRSLSLKAMLTGRWYVTGRIKMKEPLLVCRDSIQQLNFILMQENLSL